MRKSARKFDVKNYNLYVEKFKRLSIERNKTITHPELRLPEFNLPDARWLVKYCPDKNVKSFSEFVSWCGFVSKGMTKDMAIYFIYKMQSMIKRPLMYDDFRGTGCYKVPLIYIREYWGTMNKMKEELGLIIIQENMIDKHITKDEFVSQIALLIHNAKSEGRCFITTKDMDENSHTLNSCTLRNMCNKYFHMSLSDYIISIGFTMGIQGRGTNYKFKDGEKCSSQFEFIFSKYLRDYGLIFNKDYFRDIKYSDFIHGYKGNMNCDYVIKSNKKTIYIEIAGIIEAYKNWYYENRQITISNSKEKYRLKLRQKEEMLKENNLKYFVLFPCDLTRDIFMQIINDGSLELKKLIEKFVKNNIDWSKIQELGELSYIDNKTTCYGQLVVNYEKGRC